MAERAAISDTELRLRRRLSRFLDRRVLCRRPVLEIMDVLRETGASAVLFGGTIRDLAIDRPSWLPRDVDIVVQGIESDELAKVLRPYVRRRTRFGGLHLDHRGWLLDVWLLSETWALRNGLVPEIDFGSLPRTTFLSVEAIAVELFPLRGRRRRIHENGFFQAIESRVVDINLEANPFPLLCVVRALITTAKLGFAMTRRLAQYILTYTENQPVEELVQIQMNHYGLVRCQPTELMRWLGAIRKQVETSTTQRISLPVPSYRQMELWEWADMPRAIGPAPAIRRPATTIHHGRRSGSPKHIRGDSGILFEPE